MRDFLATHWIAIALLAAAATLATLPAVKRLKSRGWPYIASAFALFALGGLTLSNRSFEIFTYRFDVASQVLYFALAGFALLVFVLLFRRWSFVAGCMFGSLLLMGVGGLVETSIGAGLAEAWRSVLALQFVQPWWLVLLGFIPLVVLVARRSLSGLGPVRKWLAIGARSAIVAALAMALAEPRFGRPTDEVTVIFVVDRSLSVPQDVDLSLPVSDQVDRRWLRVRNFVEESVKQKGPRHRNDQAGVVFFGKRPKLAAPPSPAIGWTLDPLMAGPIDGQYTDIASAIKLAVASFPEGAGRRIVLVSDGNENLGNADEQAAVANQNGVQIDAVALAPGYRNENEVLVQSVEAPRQTAAGSRLPVRVLVRNASPNRLVDGLLELVRVGPDAEGADQMELLPIDADNPAVLDAGGGKKPALVRLLPGLNAFRFRDKASGPKDSSYSYRSTFTPIKSASETGTNIVKGLPGDRVANNRAGTVVVTRSQRKVLFIDGSADGKFPHEHLVRTLLKSKIDVVLRPVDKLEQNIEDLTKFLADHDCIVLADVPAEALSLDRQEAIRTCVHDQGCGLVMIGGPDAYGPGGYQGTPVEAALPVDCEIKALKAAGRGGLILIMHASEMADGNKWQKEIAKLAIRRLNPNDMVGVMQYGFGGGGVSWVIPFQDIGEKKQKLLGMVDNMVPGDMPDFDPFLRDAVATLTKPEYGLSVKHCIIISDGDPQFGPVGRTAVKKMADYNVTCTTVGVATHSGAESSKLKSIAQGTRDGKGRPGAYYEPKDPNQLPGIYIKESRRISQSFIYDKPFTPALRLRGGPTEGLPNTLPQLRGFVRTTMKESPLAEMRIEGPRMFDQQFPILATWQYGLGKAVAFTSDARTQPGSATSGWDKDWVESDVFQKFWEQSVTWAMRAAEKGKLTLMTDFKDGRVRIMVDARDDKDRPVGGLDLKGGISLPQPLKPGEKVPVITFKKKGAGLYEAEFPAEEAGSYFVTIQGYQGGPAGQPQNLFDYARTGVTVPYSQEFADLETNTPLMKRLAESTGGKFHTDDAADLDEMVKNADVFRDAPKMVRAVRPFWHWLVFAAGLLLLFDVGVRRVSLEWHELAAGLSSTWTRLRTHRESTSAGGELDRLKLRKQAVSETLQKQRAERRFEPGAAAAGPAPKGADEVISDSPSPLKAAPPPPREEKPAEESDMFSALKKAKKRVDHNRKPDEPR